MELQIFHYYQGKIQSAVVQFFFSLSQKLHQETLITKTMVSISCTQDSQETQAFAPWTKPQKISH